MDRPTDSQRRAHPVTAALAVLLVAAAVAVAVPPSRTEERLNGLGLRPPSYPRGRRKPRRSARGPRSAMSANGYANGNGNGNSIEGPPLLLTPVARTVMALAAGSAVVLTINGFAGVALGLLVMVALPRLIARLPDPRVATHARRLAGDLPLALELVAACLAAGAPFPVAVAAVSADLPGPLSAVLADVARQLDLGAPPHIAWRRAQDFPPLQALVETVRRVGDSGAALAPALHRLATEERDRAHQVQEAAVRRIGVFVVIPLGICFLPAFLLLGVVPIVAGLVGGLLV